MTSEEGIVREIVQFFENLVSYEALVFRGFDGVE